MIINFSINHHNLVVVLLVLLIGSAAVTKTDDVVEKITDDEFLNLVQTEKHVVALFSKPKCAKCDEYESELASVREALVDSLDATVIKLISSPLTKLYSPNLEPAVVFFRHGVPMLYHGAVNEDEILSKFNKCPEPTVKSLNDETFEHLTQAATGATTGDWLIMFEKRTCVQSQRLQAVLEAVACDLKHKMNVARVDKSNDGGATGRRFGITDTPSFLFFRHGKMYRYELDKITIQNLVDFATNFYRNSKGENVPAPKSPFDDFTEMIVEKMRENPQVVKLGSIGFSILIIILIFVKLSTKSQTAQKKKPKSKTDKEKKKSS